jgi:hypothetical protein
MAFHRYLSRAGLEILLSEAPVDGFPELANVFRPIVAIVDVIGMFPDVDRQNRLFGMFQRRVGISKRQDFELALGIGSQPSPTGAEQFRAGVGHRLLKGLESTKIALDGICQFTFGLPTPLRRQAIPIKRMIQRLGGIIEHGPNRLNDHFAELGDPPRVCLPPMRSNS